MGGNPTEEGMELFLQHGTGPETLELRASELPLPVVLRSNVSNARLHPIRYH